MKTEFLEERDSLLLELKRLNDSLEVKQLVIDSFIPPRYQKLIMDHIHFDELTEEWKLDFIEYTGMLLFFTYSMRLRCRKCDKRRGFGDHSR